MLKLSNAARQLCLMIVVALCTLIYEYSRYSRCDRDGATLLPLQ